MCSNEESQAQDRAATPGTGSAHSVVRAFLLEMVRIVRVAFFHTFHMFETLGDVLKGGAGKQCSDRRERQSAGLHGAQASACGDDECGALSPPVSSCSLEGRFEDEELQQILDDIQTKRSFQY